MILGVLQGIIIFMGALQESELMGDLKIMKGSSSDESVLQDTYG